MTISKMRDKIENFLWELDNFLEENRGKYAASGDDIYKALGCLDQALAAEEHATDPDRDRE